MTNVRMTVACLTPFLTAGLQAWLSPPLLLMVPASVLFGFAVGLWVSVEGREQPCGYAHVTREDDREAAEATERWITG